MLEDNDRSAIVYFVQFSRARKTLLIYFARPEVTGDRQDVRVSKQGLKTPPQVLV
jgi:hypothetical protein